MTVHQTDQLNIAMAAGGPQAAIVTEMTYLTDSSTMVMTAIPVSFCYAKRKGKRYKETAGYINGQLGCISYCLSLRKIKFLLFSAFQSTENEDIADLSDKCAPSAQQTLMHGQLAAQAQPQSQPLHQAINLLSQNQSSGPHQSQPLSQVHVQSLPTPLQLHSQNQDQSQDLPQDQIVVGPSEVVHENLKENPLRTFGEPHKEMLSEVLSQVETSVQDHLQQVLDSDSLQEPKVQTQLLPQPSTQVQQMQHPQVPTQTSLQPQSLNTSQLTSEEQFQLSASLESQSQTSQYQTHQVHLPEPLRQLESREQEGYRNISHESELLHLTSTEHQQSQTQARSDVSPVQSYDQSHEAHLTHSTGYSEVLLNDPHCQPSNQECESRQPTQGLSLVSTLPEQSQEISVQEDMKLPEQSSLYSTVAAPQTSIPNLVHSTQIYQQVS